MDNNINISGGNANFVISSVLSLLTFLITDLDVLVRILVGGGSLSTAFMACRYYYYGAAERKQQIKRNKDGKDKLL